MSLTSCGHHANETIFTLTNLFIGQQVAVFTPPPHMHTLRKILPMVENNKKTHGIIFNVDEGLYEVKHKCTELSMSRSQQYFVLLSNWRIKNMHA